MKFIKLSIVSALAVGMLACASEAPKEDVSKDAAAEAKEMSYSVFAPNSEVKWKGSMMGAYSHDGILKMSEGTVATTDGKISAGKFTIDWSTMEATDSNYSAEHPKEGLIGHLKSADFFAADSLGAAVFEITGMDGDDIVGKMTIRGITNDEKVTSVMVTEDENGITASGKMTFDRQKYEVSYKNTMGDMVISNDIELEISFTGKAADAM